jgi:SRSO17 transposase
MRQTHQSLHHLVADAPWSDEELLAEVRDQVLPAMQMQGPIVAWIVDDTGIPKKGKHSVGVARQYCGQLGKQDNCQVAVSLSVATWNSSLPILYRLYLPEDWTKDSERREKTGVPEEIRFQTKPRIALEQIRQAAQADVTRGVVLADAAYGNDSQFRAGVTELELQYMVGVQSSMTVWKPGEQPLPPKPWKGTGRPPKLVRRNGQQQPITVKELATALPPSAWKEITWREGTARKLRSRFAAVRVRPAHRDYEKAEPHAEEWLLMEWPKGEAEPIKYWVSTLPPKAKLKDLVKIAKHRWVIERDYEELKQELGLGHYEGRGWRGFHHHATLCIAAYGFLVAERNRFSPSARVGNLRLSAPEPPPDFRPRGSPGAPRAA